MIWVDSISELEFYNANPAPPPIGGCYADTVFVPSDINLQAQLGTYFDYISLTAPSMRVLKPDGTFIESGNSYFHMGVVSFNLDGITYFYANAICHTLSPGMISNGCFVLEFTVTNGTGSYTYFHKYTQKYVLANPTFILSSGVTITVAGGVNLATECIIPVEPDNCKIPFVKLVSFCDCIDAFSGDFFGNGSPIVANTSALWTFVRISWIVGRIKDLPTNIKRTISINNRTQRTERTTKYNLIGSVCFPTWKMQEIENMLLQNHIFVNDKQVQSVGDTPFTQAGQPQSCHYAYNLKLELQEPYEWQVFGCTPPCVATTYYYPLTF